MSPSLLLALILTATPAPAAPAASPAPESSATPGARGAAKERAPEAQAKEGRDRADDAGASDDEDASEPAPGSRRTGDWPAKPSGKKVSLEGTMTLDQALAKIAAAGQWNLVSTSGAEGGRSLTLRLHRVPVEDALEAVLQGTSLVASRRGLIVTVAPAPAGSTGVTGSIVIDHGSVRIDGKDVKQLRRDLRQQLRERRREARAERRSTGDRVARGDQVIKAGDAAQSVVALFGNVGLDPGASAEQVVAVIGSVVLGPSAKVDSDVVAVGGDIHLMPGAHVGGDAVSVGGQVITEEGAIVEGERTSVDVPGLAHALALVGARSWSPYASRALSVAGLIARFAVFFALALLIQAVAPRRLESLTAGLSNAPVKTAVTGVLGTLAIPLACILLAVTVIGIPLIAVLVLAILVAVAMGYSALALFIGRALPIRVERARTVIQLAIGTAVILLLGQIPVVGWMVWVTGWLFVVGVVWRTRFGRPVAPPPVYGTTPPPMPPPVPPTTPPVQPPIPPAPPSAGPVGP